MSTFVAVQVKPSEQKDEQFLEGLWDKNNEEMKGTALLSGGLLFSGGAPFARLFHTERMGSTFSVRRFRRLLEEMTGRPYGVVCLGVVTETYFFYPVDDWSEEMLSDFMARYLNTGSEWILTEPDHPEKDAIDVYCTGKTEAEIRLELLDASGAMYASDIEMVPYGEYRIGQSA
jgi:hypothetical protein